ncbi:DNA mismatch repair protein MutL [Succinivibrio dextrinosolvens]|uniref:DNA mismatch repair endonuclease MutL n=1 Tax=Succinivibrio dextrinosolvens TaxID=83771 RepID=UPI0008E0DA85|nr:DNA mismatch repair endonuclease MutL [Succinivibrio dextrinosolvens]SFS83505.1 DNA mismatch repair protein MutL [Succinivibrio dextrinosolvens]
MSSIKLLSKQLASQIAAGEVVERPSSVVKELLENAVDAGGTNILCEIRNAGKVLIRVRDNGSGIVRDELPLALAPHATSKISSVDDLAAITTLGFRGEALASIASVSKLVLTSKTADEENAYSVSVEGPEQNPTILPAAHPTGTTVDVGELFFNTPARRRFLKSDRTEFARIKDTFTRVALAHPDVGFEFISDSKTITRVAAAKGEGLDIKRTSALIGAEFGVQGMRVSCEDPNLKIEGMLLPPPREEEALSEKIYIFLNGRPLADKVVTHALKEGFFEVLGKTLPIRCVLYMEIDPAKVDVNVHPRKDEVRFHETTLIHDLIVDSIVYALRKNGIGSYQQMEVNDPLGLEQSPQQNDMPEQMHQVSPHATSYDINSSKLPAFPSGVGTVIDINKFADRGRPVIIRASEKSNSGYTSGSAVTGSSFSAPMHRGLQTNFATNTEDIQRNINIYKSTVAASNISLNARTNVETDTFRASERENGIELLDHISEKTALIRIQDRFYLLNLQILRAHLFSEEYRQEIMANRVERFKMTLPYTLNLLDEELCRKIKENYFTLQKCGFVVRVQKNKVELLEIPAKLKGANLAGIAVDMFSLIISNVSSLDSGECPDELSRIIGANIVLGANSTSAEEIISRVSDPSLLPEIKNAVRELNLKQLAHDFENNV